MNTENFQFNDSDDEIIFAPEEEENTPTNNQCWKVLIVDDEEDIHKVTKFALQDFSYKEKKIEFIDTFSAKETMKILELHSDIALILLDVMMESVHAGLELVKYIRQEIKNKEIQIVLRTGQAGYAPEKEIIVKYDINDYKTKTELTDIKLFTTITSSLRSYETLMQLKEYSCSLEKMVDERTLEIEKQRKEIKKKNNDLTASILYAKRIQNAILPKPEVFAKIFPDSFILFKPRDIVSGDFYWIKQIRNKIFLAAADCTGHGVPGAFMSMLGIALLNEILRHEQTMSAAEFLDQLRLFVKLSLQQRGKSGESQDGMDIAFCIIDKETHNLQYAGAYNPLYIIRDKKLMEFKADRMPIGVHPRDMEEFTQKDITLLPNDNIYLFSDGYASQFGGRRLEKYKTHRLQEKLLNIQDYNMETQKQILEQTWLDWKGKEQQIDDILMIGIRYNQL